MGCGWYHDHAGGGWLFCVCIGPARMAGLVFVYGLVHFVANVLSLPRCRDGRLALSSSSS